MDNKYSKEELLKKISSALKFYGDIGIKEFYDKYGISNTPIYRNFEDWKEAKREARNYED